MASEKQYGSYLQYIDNGSYNSYLPPQSDHEFINEVNNQSDDFNDHQQHQQHSESHQLPPMSSFSSLSPKSFHQASNNSQLNSTSSTTKNSTIDLSDSFNYENDQARQTTTATEASAYGSAYNQAQYVYEYQYQDTNFDQNYMTSDDYSSNFYNQNNFVETYSSEQPQQHQHDQQTSQINYDLCVNYNNNQQTQQQQQEVPSYSALASRSQSSFSPTAPSYYSQTHYNNSHQHHASESSYLTNYQANSTTNATSVAGGDLFATLDIADDGQNLDADALIEAYQPLTADGSQHSLQSQYHPVVNSVDGHESTLDSAVASYSVNNSSVTNLQVLSKSVEAQVATTLLSASKIYDHNNVPSSLSTSTTTTANDNIHQMSAAEDDNNLITGLSVNDSSETMHAIKANYSSNSSSKQQKIVTTTITAVCDDDESQSNQQQLTSQNSPVHVDSAVNSNEMVSVSESSTLIEVTKCFKCKMCEFIGLHKKDVVDHLKEKHAGCGDLLKTKLPNESNSTTNNTSRKFVCCPKCMKDFPSLELCKKHIHEIHGIDTTVKTTTKASQVKSNRRSSVNAVQNNDNVRSANELKQSTVNCSSTVTSTKEITAISAKQDQLKAENTEELSVGSVTRPQAAATNLITIINDATIVDGMSNKKFAWKKKKEREEGAYVCQHKGCNVRYQSPENLEYHEKCHSQNGDGFICLVCNNTKSIHWFSVAQHLWREHEIDLELQKCNVCSYRHYSISYLENVHKKIHSNEKNYLCNICGKAFKNKKQLINHAKRHQSKLQATAEKDQQQKHLATEEKSNEDANNNNNNNNVAPNNDDNNNIVEQQQQQEQDDCSHSLVVDVGGHKKEEKDKKKKLQYKCDQCGRQFFDARALRVHHDQVHKKLRPYVCSQCGHSAASRSALRTHVRSHTGEKPFKCDQCQYTTSDHNSLRRHRMRHSGERPYKCPFCDYACIQSSTYKQHLKSKHPDQSEGLMFACNECGFKTVNEDMYKLHLSDQHKSLKVTTTKKQKLIHSTRSDQDSSNHSSSGDSPASEPSEPSEPNSVGAFGPESPESVVMQFARGMLGQHINISDNYHHMNHLVMNGLNTPSSSPSP